MLYRPLGRTGLEVSILGFGAMRFPILDDKRDRIDVPTAADMLRYAFDHGVNYLDTGYPYHGYSMEDPGNSEAFVGDVLAEGYRDKVILATKLPPMVVRTRADMDRILNGQLERLRTDHIDCYLLHGLHGGFWRKMRDLGALEFLDSALADGRIRHAGFSFHDDVASFKEIVDAYDWGFCQIQYNYMDTDFQAGLEGLHYAAERGLGVVVMEPLKGGRLAGRIPTSVQALWDGAPVKRSPAEWGLRFVWNEPGVSTVLSGMSTMEQVVEIVAAVEGALPGSLSADELRLIEQVQEAYRARMTVDCTACGYCLPCPSGINIPNVFRHYNDITLFDDPVAPKGGYGFEVMIGMTAKASDCTECGQCEAACPQGVPVPEKLKEAVGALE